MIIGINISVLPDYNMCDFIPISISKKHEYFLPVAVEADNIPDSGREVDISLVIGCKCIYTADPIFLCFPLYVMPYYISGVIDL
ncbi:hypothetical protein D3C84_815100 [compost metagenome]